MNEIEQLQRVLQGAFPGAAIEYDPPLLATGNHHLDLQIEGHWFHVLWRMDSGFWIGYVDAADPDVGLFDQVAPRDVNVKTVAEAAETLATLIAKPRPVAAAR